MDANLDRQHKRARLALDRAIGALPWGHRVPGDCGYCKLAPRAPPRPSDGCFAAAGPTPGAAGTGDPTQLWRGKARAAGASDPTRRRRRDESRAAAAGGAGAAARRADGGGRRRKVPPTAQRPCIVCERAASDSGALAVECEGGCGNFVHAQLCAGRVNVPPELVRRAAAGVALVKGADVAASTAAKGEARGERAAPSGPMVSILVCPSCFYNVVDPTSEEFRRYNAVRCTVCRKPTDEAKLLLCDSCDAGYHTYCLRPMLPKVPQGSWYCPSCAPANEAANHVSAAAFDAACDGFARDIGALAAFLKCATLSLNVDSEDALRPNVPRAGRAGSARFVCPTPSVDPAVRLRQLASIAAALKVTDSVFSHENVFESSSCPPSADDPSLEFPEPVQRMSSTNAAVFAAFDDQSRRGLFPPIRVCHSEALGFYVVAEEDLVERTLICEYVGSVDFVWSRMTSDDDSLMDLLRTESPDTSLVISPRRIGNVARFLCHGAPGASRNVQTARFDIGGSTHVLLFASRAIARGEALTYDYNAGAAPHFVRQYPTDKFL